MPESFRSTLLVGVGGTGCEIIGRVQHLALADEGARQRVGVLGLDTDAGDIGRLNLEQRSKIRFSTADTVFRLLDLNPDLEKSWFGPRDRIPQDILNFTGIAGAGQIRLLTRLFLHHSIRRADIERRLGDALTALKQYRATDRPDDVVNVLLVGSLAGATGSGSFLQIAMMLAAVGRERRVDVEVRGLFLLPDVFTLAGNLPSEQVSNVLANGYAALKELNAINNLVNRRGDQTAFDFEFAPGRHLVEGGMPFKSVALIDFEGSRGGSFGRNLDAYKAMAARAAYQLIFSPIGQQTASVGVNDVRARLAAGADGVDNLYAGLGVSAIDYPVREVADYLALRMAQENLGGDWLRLDRAFFERVRRYEDQRKMGNLSVTPPDQGNSFLEDLNTLALKDRIVFFTEVRARLYPVVRNEAEGSAEERPRHLAFLEALQRELLDRFWSTDRISTIRQRQLLGGDNLRNMTALTDTVRRLELQIDDDLGVLDTKLKTLPEDLFNAVLLTADDLAETDWRDYHLQSHIIKGGPHLVEVRAFLYELRNAIVAELGRLDPAAARSRVFRASNVFDDTRGSMPTERRSPKTVALAGKAANRGPLTWLRGSDSFVEDFVTYYNGSMTSLRSYADQQLRATILGLLADEVDGLSKALAGLFVELGSVFEGLSRKVAKEEARHAPSAGLVDGNVPVYADAPAKRNLWEDLSRRATGLRLGEDANRKLAVAVYKRYRTDRRANQPTDIAALGGQFEQAIVDDFARTEIETRMRGAYDFSIIEAVRRQAAMEKVEWRDLLRRLVDLVSTQSEPFLSLTDDNDGQRVIFWAVNPGVRAEINDDETYGALFTFQQGEAPLVRGEFDRHTLLCMNSRVNLELRHLSKLRPASSAQANVNRPAQGRYARAYADMINGLVEAELANKVSREFTPHLDASWHRPGALPEMFPELSRAVREDQTRAYVVSVALGLITLQTEYGASVAEFSTINQVRSGGIHATIVSNHDRWEVLRAFVRRADLVRAANRKWDELAQVIRQSREAGDETVKAMTGIEPLNGLLRLAVIRDDAQARDVWVEELVAAWALLLRNLAGLYSPDLAAPGLDAMTKDWIAGARTIALGKLREDDVRDETQRQIARLLGRGLEALPPDARP
jgi:hypothetical protein